jgi:diguanylate cyclase (GGDEF)-like protein/PAS domain S-box-containing protein
MVEENGNMQSPLRVLIIENSMEKVHLLLDVLRNGGYEPTWERVETEHDMAVALETQAWDIVLATNALPHFSAPAALHVLQTRGLKLPLFVVTDRMDDAAAAVMKAGARDCVLKEDLVRLVPAIERELQHTHDRHLRKTQSEHFYTLIENLHDLAVVMAEDGVIHYTSRSSERILGYQPELLAGRNFLTYVHSEDVSVVQHVIDQAAQQSGATQLVKFRVRSSTGDWRRLEVSGSAFRGEKALLRIALTAHDVTESEAQTAALKHQSLHDELTGLPNRTLLDTELTAAVRAAQTGGKKGISLLYLDLDRFQVINDTFGYRWGDFLLQQVAPRLQGALRKTDTVARVNGDEFAVILSNIGDANGAIRIARRLLHLLEPPFQIEGHKVNLSASIGIGLCPEHGTDADTLLQRAARAVHQAKRTGIGYALYSAEQEERYNPTRLLLLHDLRQAPEQEQLLLHYQPKVEMKSGAIHQVEALIRWQHPQRGILPPDDFLPLAEESGLMKPLSQWVLNEAIRQCRVWDRDGIHLRVAVNLSMRDLQDTQLPQRIAGLLTAWGLDPASLEVEVTETAIAADIERTRQSLADLHQMGVRIAIDDFGTGYSSLAHLRQLPVDTVKIDKSFVHGLTKNDNDTAIVRATIELGHDLGLQVVAEGVEDQATWDALATLGCDLVQGYLISRPLPAVALQEWLSAAGGQLSPLVTTAASSRQQGR